MTKEELIEKLQFLIDNRDDLGAVLYFVIDEQGETIIKQADVKNEAQLELKERFLESLADRFTLNADLAFMRISEADDRKNAAYYYDLDSEIEVADILSRALENPEQPIYQFGGNNFDNLQGYVITIGDQDTAIALYKKHHPVNLLRRDRFLLIPDKQRLTQVNHDVIALDRNFDCIMVNKELVVMNVRMLERFFGFEDVIRDQATLTIAEIEAADILEDNSILEQFAESIPVARKLMRARSSPVLNIPANHIINFITVHPQLKGRIQVSDDGTKIRLTTDVSKKLFLKLLNDDYLFSELTQLQYDTHAKDRLQSEYPQG